MGLHCTCEGRPLLVKKIENGGMLLRGNAPTIAIIDGMLTIKQRCPACRRDTVYRPLTIELKKKETP